MASYPAELTTDIPEHSFLDSGNHWEKQIEFISFTHSIFFLGQTFLDSGNHWEKQNWNHIIHTYSIFFLGQTFGTSEPVVSVLPHGCRYKNIPLFYLLIAIFVSKCFFVLFTYVFKSVWHQVGSSAEENLLCEPEDRRGKNCQNGCFWFWKCFSIYSFWICFPL